jgi:hypothetical protein
MFVVAFAKTSLMEAPRVLTDAIATNAIRTTRSAYSVRSCPCSSFHSLFIIEVMFSLRAKNFVRSNTVGNLDFSPPKSDVRFSAAGKSAISTLVAEKTRLRLGL